MTGDRDRGSQRVLCCDVKQCLVLRIRAGGGCSDVWQRNSCGLIWCMVQRLERRGFAVWEGEELNRGRRCTVMWVFPQILPVCYSAFEGLRADFGLCWVK